jgi:alpha-amylase
MVRLARVVVLGLGLWMWAASAFAGPADVPFLFTSTNTSTVFGQSIFVVGSVPQLGAWDPTRSVKLAITNACVGTVCPWAVTIGIPAGTTFSYQYLVRNDCARATPTRRTFLPPRP